MEPTGADDGPETRTLRDITARGVRLRVVSAGDPGRPAVVLLHGFFASHASFDDLIDVLAQRYFVIAPDLPGFGESEKPGPARFSYGIEAFAESVADIIAAFGVGRAFVVGHAMGGAIALTLAADHAELVQRLVVVDPLCYPVPAPFRARLPLVPVFGGVIFKQLYGRGLFRAWFRDDVFGGRVFYPAARVDRHYDLFNTPAARESAHAVLRATLDTRPVVARVTRVRTPALVVWGGADKIYPAALATRLARELGNAKLAVMDAGHAPHEERPREFVRLVAQFFEGNR